MGANKTDLHRQIVEIDLNNQAVFIAYDFESGPVAFNDFSVGKITQDVLILLLAGFFHNHFPSG
jgi:hypothetical protein